MVEMYDEHNKLKRYRFLNTGAYYQIEYDAVGRVWKRIDQSSNVSHFYHTGGKLAQELDGSYNVETDYLAGLRRYMPDEAEEDQYRYYARDHQGSVVQMTGHGTEPEGYTYDAWGEHADTDSLPSAANNIRYAGARLECFVDPDNSKDAIYETGARHYWPAYGRFLQRDPLGYNTVPDPSNVIGLNPYAYADNNPVMKVDLSGLQPSGYVRGAVMGEWYVFLGTSQPQATEIHDCCSSQFTAIPDDQLDYAMLWHSKVGMQSLRWWKQRAGWQDRGFCDLNPAMAQPNEGCPHGETWMSPELACTFLASCRGAKCPEPPPPFRHPGCPTGMAPINAGSGASPISVGYLSGLTLEKLGNDIWIIIDSDGNRVPIREEQAYALLQIREGFERWYYFTEGWHSWTKWNAARSWLGIDDPKYMACIEFNEMIIGELPRWNPPASTWSWAQASYQNGYGFAPLTSYIPGRIQYEWNGGFQQDFHNFVTLYLSSGQMPEWYIRIDPYEYGAEWKIVFPVYW